MKVLKFDTIGNKSYVVKFSENDFLSYIEHCYNNLNLLSEVALFLNNVHSDKLYTVPFDSCIPESIRCNFSRFLLKKFEIISDAEKFNI